ncbi:PREDICTED: WD repeat-containing protein 49-like [Cyprinodon variegatus]|uniref:WD repeat-containing protein 49-like n=1 Tax=Cyprinodon variegatus TaxID=28743 RepID=UPI000742A100|nr:PREDICTED: WD repeat-containing protein 49-like [Cyprinodon variegatus]
MEDRMRKTPAGHLEKAKDISAPRLSDFGEDNKRLEREGRAQLEHNDSLFVSHEGEAHSFEINERISLHNLHQLKLAFEECDVRGRGYADVENFVRIMKKHLDKPIVNNEQIHSLFKKVDYSDQGRISWMEFSTYLLEQYKAKEETLRRSKQVTFNLPATMSDGVNSVPIVNIHSTHEGTVLTVREDGFVCQWSPELKPQRMKHMFNEGLLNTMSKWVTDFALMSEYSKLMTGTGDGEIQFYELSTLEPYCQISGLETIPLTLDYGQAGTDKCCFVYGDMEVSPITHTKLNFSFCRLWNRLPKAGNVPNISIKNAIHSHNITFVRWKVHNDWVTQVKYFHSFQAVASSSKEESASLVLGCVLPLKDSAQQLREIREVCYEGKNRKRQLSWTPQIRKSGDQTVFSVYKGVKAFDLCQKDGLLVTGGMDRLIRLWNTRFSEKPDGILKGHSAPIFSLCISSEDSQIFSVSTDNTVKIWHIQDQCCLFTADPTASGIHGDVTACSFSPAMRALYVAADCIAVLPLMSRPKHHGRIAVSHDEAVMCCSYSEELRQVVSCSKGSVVKVWDLESGRQVFEFTATPDLTDITCMTLDFKGRRLVTGGSNGCLKLWNFNSGQCLKTLKKGGKCHEVCDCSFLRVNENFYVVAVGRNQRIDIYLDVPEELHGIQRPEPSWKDDLKNGHKEDILCVVQCPPSFLVTGSKNGEIIVWNTASGSIQCRFLGPPGAKDLNTEGLDTSVPSMFVIKNLKLLQLSPFTALLSPGVRGWVNLWDVFEQKLVSSFEVSKFQQKITKLATTDEKTLLYAADRIGYIYIHNMEAFDAEQNSPTAEHFWRAHTGTITSLQIVTSDRMVLTSSTDQTVRLWSSQGEFIGTFGQPEMWSVQIPSSWIHPGVPDEVLIDPLTMPNHDILKRESHLSEAINSDVTETDKGELKTL